MGSRESEGPIVCAGQYSVREGLSPSEVLMRDNISKNWCKQLVSPSDQRDHKGGQGVRREVESGRHEEKDRAVIKAATLKRVGEGDGQRKKERTRRTDEQSQAGGKFPKRKTRTCSTQETG